MEKKDEMLLTEKFFCVVDGLGGGKLFNPLNPPLLKGVIILTLTDNFSA